MAIIKEENIPASTTYWKEVIKAISFEGRELDETQGRITILSTQRQITSAEDETPVLLDGHRVYRNNVEPITLDLATELAENVTIDGITTQQVFSFLSKWTDYKKGENVPGLN